MIVETKLKLDELFGEYYFEYDNCCVWISHFMTHKNGRKISWLPNGELVFLKKVDYDLGVVEYVKTGLGIDVEGGD